MKAHLEGPHRKRQHRLSGVMMKDCCCFSQCKIIPFKESANILGKQSQSKESTFRSSTARTDD